MRIVARFAGLALTFFAVFRTLDMNDMILALRWFGLPFRVSLVLIVAFRFIPSLFALYRNVEDAHALRSGGAGRRGFFRHVLPVLTSVVIQAVRAIPALAMALETRGLGRKGARTAYRELRGGPGFVLSFAVLGLLAVVLFAPLMLLP
jgi:energy-coupling factor transport system permease protein